MSVQYAKKWFTITDYYGMLNAGILKEDDRVELINGEVVEMSPSGSHHSGQINRLNFFLTKQLSDKAIIQIQNPIRLNNFSEPEPDVAVLKPRDDFYFGAHATPEDILILIEVSDTSYDFDKNIKLPLYATEKVPETWIFDLQEGRLEIYRNPVDGKYQESHFIDKGESATITVLQDITLDAATLFGF